MRYHNVFYYFIIPRAKYLHVHVILKNLYFMVFQKEKYFILYKVTDKIPVSYLYSDLKFLETRHGDNSS